MKAFPLCLRAAFLVVVGLGIFAVVASTAAYLSYTLTYRSFP